MVDKFLNQHQNHAQANFQGKTKLTQVDSDDDDDLDDIMARAGVGGF